jgi:RIO-like serine/threonine protein kinase
VNQPVSRTVLKRDLLGTVCRIDEPAQDFPAGIVRIERDTRDARWWLRLAARRLAAREARALAALRHVPGIPRLLQWDGHCLQRSWLDGQPMQRNPPRDPAYYREALRLIRRLHAAGVVHNDLAKEPNWLVAPDGSPAVVDFQLAMRPRYRGWRFRALAYDDLRHLLKHKRTYCPERLTARQRTILSRRSWPAAIWMRTGKPAYLWVTRGLLGWSDREGAGDRGH